MPQIHPTEKEIETVKGQGPQEEDQEAEIVRDPDREIENQKDQEVAPQEDPVRKDHTNIGTYHLPVMNILHQHSTRLCKPLARSHRSL